jgi:hypothetical protein
MGLDLARMGAEWDPRSSEMLSHFHRDGGPNKSDFVHLAPGMGQNPGIIGELNLYLSQGPKITTNHEQTPQKEP